MFMIFSLSLGWWEKLKQPWTLILMQHQTGFVKPSSLCLLPLSLFKTVYRASHKDFNADYLSKSFPLFFLSNPGLLVKTFQFIFFVIRWRLLAMNWPDYLVSWDNTSQERGNGRTKTSRNHQDLRKKDLTKIWETQDPRKKELIQIWRS